MEDDLKQAFRQILESACREKKYSIIAQMMGKGRGYALLNDFHLPIGYWYTLGDGEDFEEACAHEDKTNLLLQSPKTALLFQNGEIVYEADLRDAVEFVEVIQRFFAFEAAFIQTWDQVAQTYTAKVHQMGRQLLQLIRQERSENIEFVRRLRQFIALCRQALRSGFSVREVEQMLVQHLLTTPLFDLLFKKKDFVRQNAIAQEMEHVLNAISSEKFNQIEWSALYPFYSGIDDTYKALNWRWGQGFIEVIYRRFFHHQSEHSLPSAIIPLAVVQFMIASVDQLLQRHFSQSIQDKDVHILDPFLGTGTFLLQIMQYVGKRHVGHKFEAELHGNERRLLPYYLASLNIEQEFDKITGKEKAFEGICLVDTFGLAGARQASLFNPQNMERIARQTTTPIHVIMGHTPADGLSNLQPKTVLEHAALQKRIGQTYFGGKDASHQILGWLKALRWASDRVHEQGLVAFFLPNAFRHDKQYVEIRRQLRHDFDSIYILDLGAMAEVGGEEMCILFLVKDASQSELATIYYKTLPEYWETAPILHYLEEAEDIRSIDWEELRPKEEGKFPLRGLRPEFEQFLPLFGDSEFSIFHSAFQGLPFKGMKQAFNQAQRQQEGALKMFSKPFVKKWLPRQGIEESWVDPIFPNDASFRENRALVLIQKPNTPFSCLMANGLPAFTEGEVQIVPFWVYDADGQAHENLSDAALEYVQAVYQDQGIHKWAFFHYIYAMLYHPEFRERYVINLEEETPRIPLVEHFWRVVEVGKTLSGLHLYYDEIQPHRLKLKHDVSIPWANEPWKYSKDKKSIIFNKGCFIEDLVSQSLNFKMGGKAVIDGILENYQAMFQDKVWQDKMLQDGMLQSVMIQEMVRHIGQVVNVALETIRISESMPTLAFILENTHENRSKKYLNISNQILITL
jgi:predicted helicase